MAITRNYILDGLKVEQWNGRSHQSYFINKYTGVNQNERSMNMIVEPHASEFFPGVPVQG